MNVTCFCPNCDALITEPSLEEILYNTWTCEKCSAELDPTNYKTKLLFKLLEKVENLELKIYNMRS